MVFDFNTFVPDAIVLADGNYPTHPIPLKMLAEAKMVVCCDGASNSYVAKGYSPTVIIGDGDSINEDVRRRLGDRIITSADQETNDLSKAVTYLHAQGKKKIAILGATGKRECHTLGNISLLFEYMHIGIEVCMFTDYCAIYPCRDDVHLASYPGQQISIINHTAVDMKSPSLRYPIYDFKAWWQGTLNECISDECHIHARGEYLVLQDY